MNLSNIMTRLKLKLGLVNLATPFPDLDGTILSILTDITIPVFSIYYPCKDTLNISMSDLEHIEKTTEYEKVLLPDFKTRKLLYVFDVRYDTNNGSGVGYIGEIAPLYNGNLFKQMALSNAGASLINLTIPSLTFKFEHPRVLYIYNAYNTYKLQIDLGFEHDSTLASIPDTCGEEFMKLALYDIKENLYPTLKHYTEIQTAIGTINLKIDDWADAENQRRDLLNDWDDKYHLDFQPLYYR